MFFYFLVSENKPKNMFKNWKIQHAPWWCTWLDPQSLSFSKKKKKRKKQKQNKTKKKQQKKAGKTREMHENKKGREGRAKVLFLLIKYANFVASSLSRRRRYLEVAIVFD